MASEPKKDSSAEEALQAVEDALSVDFGVEDTADGETETASDEDFTPDFGDLESRLAEAANDLREESDLRGESASPSGPATISLDDEENASGSSGQEPANRDDGGAMLSGMLQPMEYRPSNVAFTIASVVSAGWLVTCIGYFFIGRQSGAFSGSTIAELIVQPSFALLAVMTVVPILLIWAFAILVRRIQEMRHAARGMAEAAIKLLQPEEVAADSVAAIGRVVRREVAAIGDGVERALARAGELEQLVQNEVNSLERSYSDSEIRLRGLVSELSNERGEILNHAERLRESLTDTHTGLTQELEQASVRIRDTVDEASARMSEALSGQHETISASLTEAGDNLSLLLSSSGSEIESRLANATDDIREDISGSATALGKHISVVGKAVASLLDTRSASIRDATQNSLQQIEDSLSARTTEFSGRIEEASEMLHTGLDSRLDRIENTLGRRGSDFVSALELKTAALDSVFERQSLAMGDVISRRLGGFGDSLNEQIDSAVHSLHERSDKLENTTRRVEGTISEYLGKFDESLRERAADIGRSFNEGRDILAETFEAGLSSVSTSALEAKLSFEDTQNAMIAALDDRVDLMSKNMESGHQRLVSEMDKIQDRSTDFVSEIEKRTEFMNQVFVQSGNSFTNALDQRAASISQNITEGHRRLAAELEKMDSGSEHLLDEIGRRTHALDDAITEASTGLTSALDARVNAIKHAMDERSGAIEDHLAAGHQRLVAELDKMDNRSTGLVAEIDKRTKRMGEVAAEAGENLGNLMDDRTTAIQRSLAEGHQRLVGELDKMEDRSSGLVGEIDKRTQRMGDVVAEAGTGLAAMLDERTGIIQRSIADGRQRLVGELDKMEDRSSGLVGDIDKRTRRMGEIVAAVGGEINSMLQQRTSDIQRSLIDGQQRLVGEFEKMGDSNAGLIAEIDRRTDAVRETLNSATGELANTFAAGASELQESLVSGRGMVASEFGRGTQQIIASIEEKQRGLAGHLSETIELTGIQFDQKAEQLNALLTERAIQINKTLGAELVGAQRNLEVRTNEFSTALAERTRELASAIESQGTPIIEGIKANGGEMISQIEAVATTLASDIATLLSTLTQTSRGLDSAIGIAGDSIRTIEQNIVESTTRLDESVERANLHAENASQSAQNAADSLNESVEYLSKNVSSSAFRFDKQAKQLFEAAEDITNAQKQLAAVLDARQEPIEKLAHDLAERSTQIESSMTHFAGSLTTLIRNMIKEANSAGAKLNSELETAFDRAIGRLNETVSAMRGASQQIERELEATREQVRRGVLQLPDETRESADAMRRVVSDQIAALKDLSEIVAKSGKTFETSRAAALPSQRAAAASAVAATSRQYGRDGDAGSGMTASAQPALQQPQSEPVRPAPIADGRSTARERVTELASGFRGPSGDTGAAQAVEEPAQGGWVSELLRRASRDGDDTPVSGHEDVQPGKPETHKSTANKKTATEGNRSPLHVVESLNSLSMDIARAIDHDAFIDLWERYQRGERNVFTRRLYTLQGEKTFDEIKSKYNREAEFQRAVDRYIADFEKLLKDVSRNDRDNIMTQTYLTSDTGKVYTMLAHAAGRF